MLSPRFGDIFRGNSGKQGLLAGEVAEPDIEALWALIEAQPGIRVDVDLVAETVTAGTLRCRSRSTITLGGGSSRGWTTSGSPCETRTIDRFERPARAGGREHCRSSSHRRRSICLNSLGEDARNTARRLGSRRPDHDQRRQAAAWSHRGERGQEPRHQGDGGLAARRDAERAEGRPEHQRRPRRARPARGPRRARGRGRPGGRAPPRPVERGERPLRRDRRARRLEPHPDPVLRTAAAPPRRGVHPRPRRLPHRRPSDRLPPGRAAQVRRRRGEASEGIRLSAPNGLKGAKVELPYPSVGATEQVLLTAVRAEGITELKGAAIEPEIMDLIDILQKMGAIITVETDRVIRIEGVERLEGYTHRALFDRNEAASWASAALATDGDIFVGGATPVRDDDLPQRLPQGRRAVRDPRRRHPLLAPGNPAEPRLHRDGCAPRLHDGLAAAARRRPHPGAGRVDRARDRLRAALRLRRRPHRHGRRDPGAQGLPRRAGLPLRPAQLQPLRRDRRAARQLHGADIEVPDLRGGFSHLIAALSAEGPSTVSNVGIIARGYENFIGKLQQLGADFVLEG